MLILTLLLTCLGVKIEDPPYFKYAYVSEDEELISRYIANDFRDFLNKINGRYFYWDEIKYRKDLPFNPEKSWFLIKFHRTLNYKQLSLGKYIFRYVLTQAIQKDIHEFDLKLIGGLYRNPITENEKLEYFKNSLLEEAIASSQIEGAATTTVIAREMLKTNRLPRNESEQMIFNNLRGIRFMQEELQSDLSFNLILELHKIMTANTSAESCAGSFRDGIIHVLDHVDGEIAHIPPDHSQVADLMEQLCDFVNKDDEFVHPVIKASILHFLIGFIHPFKDGNGRTARALFYWYLLKKGYSLIKNISISRAILDSRIQYDKTFLRTEHDENDLTYFINYSIKSLRVAFESLVRYRDKKKEERENSDVVAYKLIQKGLNKRQSDLLGYLFFKESAKVNITSYAERHDIVRQTAGKDLNELKKLELVITEKEGRNVWIQLSSRDKINEFLENN